MDWVRLYHETPTDPKWRVIAKRSGQRIGDVIAVWNFVLCNASGNAVKRGVTRNLVTEDIAAALDLNDADVTAILAAMEGKVIKNGALQGWEKRNPIKEDHSTERVRAFRERNETQRNAEKRPELDKSREEKSKKEEVERASAPPAKATRWPPDKIVPQDWLADADIQRHEHDLPVIDLRLEATRFANYWASKSGGAATKTDWHRTWINWALDDKQNRSHAKASVHDKGTQGAAIVLAKMERGNASGFDSGARALSGPLSANGHGPEEVGGTVRDLHRGLQGQEPGGGPLRLPEVQAKPG